ncbi:MAG: hypothetical protein RQ741_13620, partial [Wenzhouxiangellaceae bacterium]|nr:hypothetical protein [Wenzhouxiangellaceae bacterium]
PDDGFTSDALNVTATAAGDPQISVAGPTTIATGADTDYTVSCDNTMQGNFTSTITVGWDDPVTGARDSGTIGATCDVTNAVPSFTSVPVAPGPLAFGVVTNGVTSAALGIDVGNDGVGPAPDSDLTIAGIATDNPVFTATLVNAGPFPVGAPDGTDDITVTCTPDAVGPITGTLTVTHNGDDNPTAFDLTCEGESDATFVSDPAPGGVLNLGVVPPGSTTQEGFIDFSNEGTVDELAVSCSVADVAGVFSFTPNPIAFTLAPGATESAGFQCTPDSPASFEAVVSCDITGGPDPIAAEYTVLCQGQPLVVPTMSRWGLMVLSLSLLLVAGFAGRRMMA